MPFRFVFAVDHNLLSEFVCPHPSIADLFVFCDLKRDFQFGSGAVSLSSDIVPSLILGAILTSDTASEHQSSVDEHIPDIGGGSRVFVYNQNTKDSLLSWIVHRVVTCASMFGNQLSQASLEIAALQRLWRQQEASLRALEQVIPPQRLALSLPPSGQSVALSCCCERALVQEFGYFFERIAVFELHFHEVGFSGLVKIEARGAYSDRLLSSWTVMESSLVNGWNRFIFSDDEAAPLSEAVKLIILADPNCTSRLSLAGRTANRRLVAVGTSLSEFGCPIAARVFDGVRGLSVGAEPLGFLSDSQHQVARATRCKADRLLAAAVRAAGTRQEFVRLDDEGLLVHPTQRGMSLAVSSRVRLDGVRAICAEVGLSHENAASTDFGITVLPSSALFNPFRAFTRFQRRHFMRRLASQTTWITLAGREEGRLTHALETPHESEVDLYFLTKPTDISTDFAWAFFRHVYIDVEPRGISA